MMTVLRCPNTMCTLHYSKGPQLLFFVTTPGNVWTNPIKSHPFLPVYEFTIPLYWFYIKFRGRGRVKGGD